MEFVRDPSSKKAALCGRRAGKTWGIACWLLEGMERLPGARSAYVTLTRGQATRVIWEPVLSKMAKKYGLPIWSTGNNDGQRIIKHANGSTLWITGCSDRSEIDKFRGAPLYRVVIDEAQAFPDWLPELVNDAIDPSLMDLDGAVALTGTPSASAIGYFHDVTTGGVKGWSVDHRWTVLDNPYLRGEAYLAKKRAEMEWDDDSPTYAREWLGKWVDDMGAKIYPFVQGKNDWTPDLSSDAPYGLPTGDYDFGLGVDLGYSRMAKTTGFALVASRRGYRQCFVIRSFKRTKMAPIELSEFVGRVRDEVRNEAGKNLRVIVDEGGLGGGFSDTMRALGVACESAPKQGKWSNQQHVGHLITSGALRADYRNCSELIDEAHKVVFDEKMLGKEDDRFPKHCCDALLYVTMALFPRFSGALQGPPLEVGSTAHIQATLKAEKERRASEIERRRRKAATGI